MLGCGGHKRQVPWVGSLSLQLPSRVPFTSTAVLFHWSSDALGVLKVSPLLHTFLPCALFLTQRLYFPLAAWNLGRTLSRQLWAGLKVLGNQTEH